MFYIFHLLINRDNSTECGFSNQVYWFIIIVHMKIAPLVGKYMFPTISHIWRAVYMCHSVMNFWRSWKCIWGFIEPAGPNNPFGSCERTEDCWVRRWGGRRRNVQLDSAVTRGFLKWGIRKSMGVAKCSKRWDLGYHRFEKPPDDVYTVYIYIEIYSIHMWYPLTIGFSHSTNGCRLQMPNTECIGNEGSKVCSCKACACVRQKMQHIPGGKVTCGKSPWVNHGKS